MQNDEEKWAQEYEKTLTELYGPPAKRRRREQGYFANLCGRHSEALIRDILQALAQSDPNDFAPVQRLQSMDSASAPLNELLRPCDYPFFYLNQIRWVDGLLHVTAVHGIRMAGGTHRFILRKTATGLTIHEQAEQSVF